MMAQNTRASPKVVREAGMPWTTGSLQRLSQQGRNDRHSPLMSDYLNSATLDGSLPDVHKSPDWHDFKKSFLR